MATASKNGGLAYLLILLREWVRPPLGPCLRGAQFGRLSLKASIRVKLSLRFFQHVCAAPFLKLRRYPWLITLTNHFWWQSQGSTTEPIGSARCALLAHSNYSILYCVGVACHLRSKPATADS